MATGTAGDAGQRYHTNQVHYFFKTVTYSTLAASTSSNRVKVWDLPPNHLILSGGVHVITGFDDTNGDDLDVGVLGTDDDLFHSGCDMNSEATTAFDDLAAANDFSATARTVTCNLTTAATGNGTAGEAIVFGSYIVIRDR